MFYKELGETDICLSDTESRKISASAGFVWTDDAKGNVSELLSHADEALYEMKKDTKGYYVEYQLKNHPDC